MAQALASRDDTEPVGAVSCIMETHFLQRSSIIWFLWSTDRDSKFMHCFLSQFEMMDTILLLLSLCFAHYQTYVLVNEYDIRMMKKLMLDGKVCICRLLIISKEIWDFSREASRLKLMQVI